MYRMGKRTWYAMHMLLEYVRSVLLGDMGVQNCSGKHMCSTFGNNRKLASTCCCCAQVKPARPPLITAEDLAKCGQSGVFFSCLSDVKQFYEYNYRWVSVEYNTGACAFVLAA